MDLPANPIQWLFDSASGPADRFIPRWLFLRALAAIYFSAFLALVFQIQGLNGPNGILPAGGYLAAVAHALGPSKLDHLWNAPTLFWLSSSAHMLTAVVWIGLIASLTAFANLWPRLSFFLCFVCFLSFVAAAGDFSGYQSDGMLLEAGCIALFFSPRGLHPGLGLANPPSRASLFLLQWEWFRIYFESGLVKLLSGDQHWRHLTAMVDYYQNSPLPTWIGWYANHLPLWFQKASTAGTLLLELAIVTALFLPRPFRLACFLIVTPWEIVVILTGNYAFLNYIVLSLGILLIDDNALHRFLPTSFRNTLPQPTADDATITATPPSPRKHPLRTIQLALSAALLTWIAYATTAELILMLIPDAPIPSSPAQVLAPFRIANQYGLFAVMTGGRYEIEFQGSNDNQNWTPYPFRFKPQALNERPGIYAPYQPRFDWNLWFASLGSWQQNDIVPITQARLLQNDPAVLSLFRANPFPNAPPKYVRAVLWQYWFTTLDEKRRTGNWWRRQLLGDYSPTLTLNAAGEVNAINDPPDLPPHS